MPPGEPGPMYDPERRISKWANFVEHLESHDETVVLESSLFQRQTNAFVGALRESETGPFVTAVYSCIQNLDAALIYSRHLTSISIFAGLKHKGRAH